MEKGGVFEEGGGAEAADGGEGCGVGEERCEGVEGGVGRWGREVSYERWVLGFLSVCSFRTPGQRRMGNGEG